jgi:hypothetical protein
MGQLVVKNLGRIKGNFPVFIFIVALLFRLVPVIVTRDMGIGLDDMFQYDMLARSIASGDGYRWYAEKDLPIVLPYLQLDLTSIDYDPRGVLTSFRPPLYPAFLAVIYFIFGMGIKRFFIARLAQALLAASLAPLTYTLALRLFPAKKRAARVSAWVITLYPMLVIYPLSLATENLFFVLVLCSLLVLLKAKDSLPRNNPGVEQSRYFLVRNRWFLLSGVLIGMTCLTRSVAQLFAILAIFWVWHCLKSHKQALITLSVIFIIIAPWMVRNSLLYGKVTGIESAIGYDLYLGYHPLGTGTFQYPQSLDLMTMMNDSERDQIGIQKTLEFIKADPGRTLYLLFRRAGYFFGLEKRILTYFYSNNYFGYISSPVLGMIYILFCLPFVMVSTSGVMGLATIKWRSATWILALFLIGYILPHLLIIAEDRFHLTTVPFLAILSAQFWDGGWSSLRARWKGTQVGKAAIILALIAILLLFANWGLELWRDSDKIALLFGPNGNQAYFSY